VALLSKSEVLANKQNNGVAILTLNRPDTLNSLNLNMIRLINEYLTAWESDPDVKLVIMTSASDRAFCAGGDMKSIYDTKNNQSGQKLALDFFDEEYKLDQYIYSYPKPIIANLNGIIMGGGVGLTYGAKYRIITEKTRWAMPEVNLSFFPDVGGGYFLNKMPNYTGVYLGLTGEMINGMDVLYANAADYLIPSSQIDECMKDIIGESSYSTEFIEEQLKEKLEKYKSDYDGSELENKSTFINKHFQFNSVEEILSSLKSGDSVFAQETYEMLSKKSPVSLKVIFKQLADYKNKTIEESLVMDKILVTNFLKFDDFYEGVRSVLIDKDRNPQYDYSTLDDVSESFIKSFFKDKTTSVHR